MQDRNSTNKKGLFKVLSIVILIGLAVLLLWTSNYYSNQAIPAFYAGAYFDGEYRIEDGPWQKITEDEHIPATKGDVTLRGNFHLTMPTGEYIGPCEAGIPIAFYTKHINITIHEPGFEPMVLDVENKMLGESVCGEEWHSYVLMSNGKEPIEIIIHNPHKYGNEDAIDNLLNGFNTWPGIEFERDIINSGDAYRVFGISLFAVALVILGTAVFATLLHFNASLRIWTVGLAILCAGGYCIFTAPGISFLSRSIVTNTIMLGLCMMFYMFFLYNTIANSIKFSEKLSTFFVNFLGVANVVIIAIPLVTDVYFFDMLPIWILVQTIANIALLVILLKEFISQDKKTKLLCIAGMIPLIAFELDAITAATGSWKGTIFSSAVFIVLLIAAIVMVWMIIPKNINASIKAKEIEAEKKAIEAELQEKRIAIMLSQIRPHFIYNTLGTIERLCLKSPEKAFELVRNFSLYLRGNFSELESTTPIHFSQEIKHVQHYVDIEKTRFPDITVEYDLKDIDFFLPALSVQPLVENAIKHGIMGLETGGKVTISAYETESEYIVEVKDDGIGFDPTEDFDKKKHIGIRNIRSRLEDMVDGKLFVESEHLKGTVATIRIPKEERK